MNTGHAIALTTCDLNKFSDIARGAVPLPLMETMHLGYFSAAVIAPPLAGLDRDATHFAASLTNADALFSLQPAGFVGLRCFSQDAKLF